MGRIWVAASGKNGVCGDMCARRRRELFPHGGVFFDARSLFCLSIRALCFVSIRRLSPLSEELVELCASGVGEGAATEEAEQVGSPPVAVQRQIDQRRRVKPHSHDRHAVLAPAAKAARGASGEEESAGTRREWSRWATSLRRHAAPRDALHRVASAHCDEPWGACGLVLAEQDEAGVAREGDVGGVAAQGDQAVHAHAQRVDGGGATEQVAHYAEVDDFNLAHCTGT